MILSTILFMRLSPDLFPQSEDIRLEPELYEPCKSDISRLCPNVAFGNAQVTGWRRKKRKRIRPAACRSLSLRPPCASADDGVLEGAKEAAEPALPPADLQAAGGGDERPRARLPADEGLQADDQGMGEEGMTIIIPMVTIIMHFMMAKLKKEKKDFYWLLARRLQHCVATPANAYIL